MSEFDVIAAGGLCGVGVPGLVPQEDIVPNYVAMPWRNQTLKGRLRNFFAWSPGWGFPLRGHGLPVKVRDMLPTFQASRGGIRFQTPVESIHV